MNYLRITNNGLICAEDLMLIGSSTKRDQEGKIGFFGSGWKFALSWLLRNDCKPVIYSGEAEITVDYTVKLHRENPVKIITVNGAETSLTTEMGPKWTGWMALREIISNSIDEGGYDLRSEYNPVFRAELDKTTIYIPLNLELGNVMLAFDNYFAFNRKPNYEFKGGRIFLKQEKSKINFYRKGIRCHDSIKESFLDFDLNEVNIDENRLATSYDIAMQIRKMVNENSDGQLLKKILLEDESYWCDNVKPNEAVLNALKELIAQGDTFTTNNIKNLTGSIFSGVKALSIPQEWYDTLRSMKLIKSPFQFLGASLQFLRTDERNVEGVHYHLGEFNIKMPIQSGSCNKEAVFYNGIGYVKADTKLNDKEIAARLLGTSTEAYWKEKLGVASNVGIADIDDDLFF